MKKINHHSNDPPKPKRKWQHIIWTSQSYHVEHETGLILTKNEIKNEKYIKLYQEKYYQVSETEPRGLITYITIYIRHPQRSLF